MRSLVADLVLIAHFCLAAYIVLGLGAIATYRWHGWACVRGFRVRAIHAAAIVIVALESLLGARCPLTVWEDALRQTQAQTGFVERWIGRLLYWDLPGWVFEAAYVCAAIGTLVAWVALPPYRKRFNERTAQPRE